ncbi:hypothetical protein BGX28_006714 [Mortierella sp. GBA30]|nr:hypothetical protein BGX28_006714 [Mortierella sp. GBA30]
MADSPRQSVSETVALEYHAKLNARLVQESVGTGNTTVHGIPPFTLPRADGTLEASPDIPINVSQTATARMMRRRQGDAFRGDQDGDGNHTNSQGYRDGNDDYDMGGSKNRENPSRPLSGAYGSGLTTRRPLLQRVRKAIMPALIGGLFAWYFDAVGILVYRNDPRIKGYVEATHTGRSINTDVKRL